MNKDLKPELDLLNSTLSSIEKVLNLDQMQKEIKDLEKEASSPNLWDDANYAQTITTKLSYLQSEFNKVSNLRQKIDDLYVLIELATDEDDASAMQDVSKEIEKLDLELRELEVKTLLSGEYDAREALITIRSEAGGVDAADWAEMLLRMYLRFCERKNWKTDVYETSYAERSEEHTSELQSH